MTTNLGWYEAPAFLKRAVGMLTILALLVSLAGPIPFAFADTTPLQSASVDDAPSADWVNPGNAFASDNVYATNVGEAEEQGYSGFNFSVPAGSTIQGIEVLVEAKSSDASGCQLEVELVWDGGTSGTTDIVQPLTGSDSILPFGGATNTWGRTWASTEFSNANFVVMTEFDDVGPGNTCANGTTVSVDHVQARVHFTPPVTPAPNPELSNSCGLDIALVMDSSGSVNSTELAQMKDAFEEFVNAFLPATPTLFSVVDFDTSASVSQTFTTDVGLLSTAINAPTSGGSTNWEAGLLAAHGTFDPRSDSEHPDLIVFASDGNPTVPGSEANALNVAITAANTIKGAGTRIIALGVGDGLDITNLEAIAGPGAVYTSNFDTLANDLATLASELCGGTITVNKVVDQDGNLETLGDQTASAGWTFSVNGNNYVTGETGQTEAIAVDDGTYDVTETVQEGFVPVGASCTSNDGEQGTWNSSNAVTGVAVSNTEIVTCTFYNAPLPTLTVTKTVDGAGVPSDFTIHVKDGSSVDVSGSPFSGSNAGTELTLQPGTYNVSETETLDADYTPTFGGSCPGGVVTLAYGENKTCTILNTEIIPEPETGTITVTKVVTNNQGGSLAASSFTVKVSDESTVLSSGNGSTVANDLVAGTYYISEDAVAGYTQELIDCNAGETDVPVGEGGAITLGEGQSVSCTIFNGDDPVLPVIQVTKILCQDEADLPNWGQAGGPNITSTTAANFLNDHPNCSLEDGWSFQYAPEGNVNPGDNASEAIAPWVTFGPTNISGVTTVTLEPTSLVWLREVMQSGYVPFEGADNSSNVSAEFYCHDDVLNYDNFDFITPLSYGQTYYCVAFNAVEPQPEVGTIVIVKDAINGDGTFEFTIENGEDGDGFEITTTEGGGSVEYENLTPGNYTITELVPEGWDLASVECIYDELSIGSDVENGKLVTLEAGDTVTCTFTNTLEEVPPQCSNGVDDSDSEDELSDMDDPGCHTDGNPENSESYDPNDNDETNVEIDTQCSDDLDNDGDGLNDKLDPGCHSDGNPGNPDSYNPSDNDENNSGGGGGNTGGGGGGGGPLILGGGGGGGGLVLGATATGEVLGQACGLYMDKFIRLGKRNNVEQVMKLQEFLNKWMNAGLPVTGTYGPMSVAAVNAFQTKYADEILTPWNLNQPTGIVFLTTLRWINMLECPELALQVPGLVEWGQHPETEK